MSVWIIYTSAEKMRGKLSFIDCEMLQYLTIISQKVWDVRVAYNYISKTVRC